MCCKSVWPFALCNCRILCCVFNSPDLSACMFPSQLQSATKATNCVGMWQYAELAFLLCVELRVTYAAVLYLISFSASLGAVWSLHKTRMELYISIRHCSLVPIVQAGRVRYAAWPHTVVRAAPSSQTTACNAQSDDADDRTRHCMRWLVLHMH